ncbi:hypothetical protein ACWC9U_38520 [Streptomyces sp. 900116325]
MQPAPESPDPAETVRSARFGELPKRIVPEEMIEERPATMPSPATNYNADE